MNRFFQNRVFAGCSRKAWPSWSGDERCAEAMSGQFTPFQTSFSVRHSGESRNPASGKHWILTLARTLDIRSNDVFLSLELPRLRFRKKILQKIACNSAPIDFGRTKIINR